MPHYSTFSNASTAPLHSKLDPRLETKEVSKPKDPTLLSAVEASKRLAAYAAVDNHIKAHHRVIGIGSGTTVPYVVERIMSHGTAINDTRWFIPTGFQSKELIVKAGLNLGDVDQFPSIDVTIDGADEVDEHLNAIKGGGACHLREKVLAEAAEQFILVADERKNSTLLGTSWKQGVPIEVAPFAWAKVMRNIQKMGCPDAAVRMGKAKAGPVVTDNGNFVIDAPFEASYMRDPAELLYRLKMLTGVLEVGLFCGMAKVAYFGNNDGSMTIRYRDGQIVHLSQTESQRKYGGTTSHHVDTINPSPCPLTTSTTAASPAAAPTNANANDNDNENENANATLGMTKMNTPTASDRSAVVSAAQVMSPPTTHSNHQPTFLHHKFVPT